MLINILILVLYTIDLLTLKETRNNINSMSKLKKDDISKLGHKINQLKKRILRTEVSGNTTKVQFRQMRINKIKKQIREIQAKRKKK